jgi:hypothetical protein
MLTLSRKWLVNSESKPLLGPPYQSSSGESFPNRTLYEGSTGNLIQFSISCLNCFTFFNSPASYSWWTDEGMQRVVANL